MRNRSRVPSLESLDPRALLAVSLSGGTLLIQAPMVANNVALVAPTDHGTVSVVVNGDTTEFPASAVQAVVYLGGWGGHDTFTNGTSLLSVDYAWGGGNTITGGTGSDYVFAFGDGNALSGGGGFDVVFGHGGKDDASGFTYEF